MIRATRCRWLIFMYVAACCVSYPEGKIICTSDDECPSGFTCRARAADDAELLCFSGGTAARPAADGGAAGARSNELPPGTEPSIDATVDASSACASSCEACSEVQFCESPASQPNPGGTKCRQTSPACTREQALKDCNEDIPVVCGARREPFYMEYL